MKASGATEYHFCFLLFGCPNGSSAPATTRFAPSTLWTAVANELTIARYALALTGPRSRLRFGSFQTWKTCSAGSPFVPS